MTKTKRTPPSRRAPQRGAALPSTRLLTAQEAAEVLAISTAKLAELAKEGEIPCVRLGRAVRYDHTDLEALIERSKSRK